MSDEAAMQKAASYLIRSGGSFPYNNTVRKPKTRVNFVSWQNKTWKIHTLHFVPAALSAWHEELFLRILSKHGIFLPYQKRMLWLGWGQCRCR